MYRWALELDPHLGQAYAALGRTLAAHGNRAKTLRVLRHGVTAASRPEAVTKALAEVEGQAEPGGG